MNAVDDPARCGFCGAQVVPGSLHCGRCGARMAAIQSRDKTQDERGGRADVSNQTERAGYGESSGRPATAGSFDPPKLSREVFPGAAAVTAPLEHAEASVVAPTNKAGRRREPRHVLLMVGMGLCGAFILGFAAWHHSSSQASAERHTRESEVSLLDQRLTALGQRLATVESANSKLTGEIAKQQRTSNAGLAPLAARMLRSVFTIETDTELGTAWAAWKTPGHTFLITANHVIAAVGTDGKVTILQKNSRWKGVVVRTDRTNDLALIRVDKQISSPLWQDSSVQPSPAPGSTMVLVGSPYGLEGTVTTGVVSRVTYNRIQTDAAANPGNSGGPAVDTKGEVIGILVSGGGENINFTIPIDRACVTLRHCT